MSAEMTRIVGSLFHGWWELFTLFVGLLISAGLLGWSANRGLRPAERGPLVQAIPFILAFALLLIVRHVQDDRWNAIIIALSTTIAAFLVAKSGTRAPVLPLMMVATLLGFGLHLSALILLLAGVLVLVFSRSTSK